jgi:hypothetical protein
VKAVRLFPNLLLASFLVMSCNSPTTTPSGDSPAVIPFTITAQVDGVPFSANASMTITEYSSTSPYLVNLKSAASANRSLDLSFFIVKNSTTISSFNGVYSEGAASWSATLDSSTVAISSFTYSPSDTTISASFSFRGWGGASGGTLTKKVITNGTVTTN